MQTTEERISLPQGELVYVVYTLSGHCGHEVIDRIFFDKQKAQQYQHKANIEWAKYMGSYDGTRRCFDITTKRLDDSKEFNFDCDVCGYSTCECFPNLEYKTEKLYEQYWSKERQNHNHNHTFDNPLSNCKFCQDDQSLWWIPAINDSSPKE